MNYKCNNCNKSYKHRQSLFRHKNKCNNINNKCNINNISSNDDVSLKMCSPSVASAYKICSPSVAQNSLHVSISNNPAYYV